jgi:hypothetical protein
MTLHSVEGMKKPDGGTNQPVGLDGIKFQAVHLDQVLFTFGPLLSGCFFDL